MSYMQDFAHLLARPRAVHESIAGRLRTSRAAPHQCRAGPRGRTASTLVRRDGALAGRPLALAALAPTAHAAGLGRLNVHSDLGQPLDAEVEVPAVGRDEAPSLQVRLASQAAFKQANLEFNPSLTQLRFDLQTKADGSYVVHITSAQAISEPYFLTCCSN